MYVFRFLVVRNWRYFGMLEAALLKLHWDRASLSALVDGHVPTCFEQREAVQGREPRFNLAQQEAG